MQTDRSKQKNSNFLDASPSVAPATDSEPSPDPDPTIPPPSPCSFGLQDEFVLTSVRTAWNLHTKIRTGGAAQKNKQ